MPKKSKYNDLYKPAPAQIIFNEWDDVLDHIPYDLPPCPPFEEIDGYGLPPDEQIFRRRELPPHLKALNAKRYVNPDDYWDEIRDNYEFFKDEIELPYYELLKKTGKYESWMRDQKGWELSFIELEWYRRKHGYVFFNNGVPTRITGLHHYYLTAFKMSTKRGKPQPEYRYKDYIDFWFKKFCEDDPDCYGYTRNEGRQSGKTGSAMCWMLEKITRTYNKNGGIQSMTELDAEKKAFAQFLVPAFLDTPFYFLPRHAGEVKPKRAVKFEQKGKSSSKKSKERQSNFLDSEIDYKSAKKEGYDGASKLICYVADEAGKTVEENIHVRHGVVKKCIEDGNRIVGMLIYTTTVEKENRLDAEKSKTLYRDAMKNWQRLCEESHYREKLTSPTGRTTSGLYNFFLPYYLGLPGFIDKHGDPVIDTPENPIMGIDGKWIKEGARTWILKKRKQLEDRQDWNGLADLKRREPMLYRECFSVAEGDCVFNIAIIEKRLSDLARVTIAGKNPYVHYAFLRWHRKVGNQWEYVNEADANELPSFEELVGGNAKVIYEPSNDPSYSDWEISRLPKPGMENKLTWDYESDGYAPANQTLFGAGGDGIKFLEGKTIRHSSKPCCVVYGKFDSTIDNPLIDPMEINPLTGDFMHTTDRVCAFYMKRTKTHTEYLENFLKACIFFGCTMYPEINCPDIMDWFGDYRGFQNYLAYKVEKGKKALKPGDWMSEKIYTEGSNEIGRYADNRLAREVHVTVIEHIRNVGMGDDPKDNDAFIATMMALLNCKHSNIAERMARKTVIPQLDLALIENMFTT